MITLCKHVQWSIRRGCAKDVGPYRTGGGHYNRLCTNIHDCSQKQGQVIEANNLEDKITNKEMVKGQDYNFSQGLNAT